MARIIHLKIGCCDYIFPDNNYSYTIWLSRPDRVHQNAMLMKNQEEIPCPYSNSRHSW